MPVLSSGEVPAAPPNDGFGQFFGGDSMSGDSIRRDRAAASENDIFGQFFGGGEDPFRHLFGEGNPLGQATDRGTYSINSAGTM